jgi:hypothetical protein
VKGEQKKRKGKIIEGTSNESREQKGRLKKGD